MIRLRYFLTILLLLAACTAHAQVAGSGTSFVVTIPAGATANIYTIPMPRLLIASEPGASVRVQYGPRGPVDNLTIPPGGSDETTLDSAVVMLPQEEGTFTNTLLITSDNPITVALLLDRSFASEGYAALPDTLLGVEYFAVSTNENEYGSSITVVGVHDSTTVTITPTAGTKGGGTRGVPFTVRLNRGEVYQALTDPFVDVDFTGTTIVSDKPCGVLSGAICADLNVGFEHRCNPLIEQLPPVSSWGREFVVGPLERASLTPFRVVARCGNTSVKINGRELAVLNRGEHFQMLLDTIYRVSTSQPVMMAAMVASTSRGLQDRSEAYGDPAMMIAPPRDQWGRGYAIVIPSLIARQDAGGPVGWRHFLQIAFIDSTRPGITVDGVPPVFQRVMRDSIFTIATVELGPGSHTVKSTAPIGVLTYGYSVSDAYGYNPASIDHRYLLSTPDVNETTCAAAFDTTIVVTNLSSVPVTVDTAEFMMGLDGKVTDPAFPFTIPPGETRSVRVHIGRIDAGGGSGIFNLGGGGSCPTRLLSARIDIRGRVLASTPPAGSLIDFGTLPTTILSSDRTIRLTNRSRTPMTIDQPLLTPAEYTIVAPGFPLDLPPGESIDLTIRFTPTAEGRFNGRLALHVAGCPDSLIMPLVGVRRQGSYLSIVSPSPQALACNGKAPRPFPFKITNNGDLPLNIIDAVIVGVPDFTLTTPLRGAIIAPGDSLLGSALFTPGPLGRRIAILQLTTNAINDGSMHIGLEATNDTALLRASVARLDLGTSNPCDSAATLRFTIYNDGTLDLNSFDHLLLGRTPVTVEIERVDPQLVIGDSLMVSVTIDAALTGAIDDTIRIVAGPCARLDIPIRGRSMRASLVADRDTIDFGVVPGCDSLRDRTLVLRNNGAVNDTIALDHFPPSMVEGNPNDFARIIAPGDSVVIPLRYRPIAAGSLLDSIDVLWGPCARRKRVIVRGTFDPTLPSFSPAALDFGPTVRGVGTRRSLWLVNRSRVRHTIGTGAVGGGLRDVRFTGATGTATIEPGDSILVELEYIPDTIGDTLRGDIAIPLVAPCIDTVRLAVSGHSIGERTSFSLRWANDSAYVGAVAPLRLEVEQTGDAIVDDTLELRTTLHLDGTILVPLEVGGGSQDIVASIVDDRLVGDARLLTLQARGLFPRTGTLAEVRTRVALGGADSTLLAFDTVRLVRAASGSPLPLRDTVNGIFRVLGLCRIGTTRLIGTAGFFRLGASRPNPASDMATIEFETNEDAWVRLSLGDIGGRERRMLLDDRMAPGIYQLTIDARALPSGIYLITLETPTQRAQGEMVVVK